MKIKRSHMLLFAFVSLFMFLSLIQETYAKYSTKATANADLTIARWNILINTQDVTSNSNFSNKVEPVFPGSEHIASGILAPNSEGYFDLVVDSTNADVSFNQTITLSNADDNTITDLQIVGYSINGGTMVNFTDNNTIITNDVLLSSNTPSNTYRIYVKWLEGTGETMDNTADTEATSDGIAKINIEVDFVQIAS